MADIYVLVHGAWHTGAEMEATARHLRARGHTVHCPTLAGNRPGDDRAATGLVDAVDSLAAFIDSQSLTDVRLAGHGYGGMVISHMPARLPGRIRRLAYRNAFAPRDGECLNDLVPAHYRALFDQIAAASGNAVMLPCAIWRDAFINDADEILARSSYAHLNPHPYRTFTDPAQLPAPLAALEIGKSYLMRIKTPRCPTACLGTRACRSGWACSAWWSARAVTRYVFRIRRWQQTASSVRAGIDRGSVLMIGAWGAA